MNRIGSQKTVRDLHQNLFPTGSRSSRVTFPVAIPKEESSDGIRGLQATQLCTFPIRHNECTGILPAYTRFFSTFARNGRKNGKQRRRKPSKSTVHNGASERTVRDTTNKILQLGNAARTSAMDGGESISNLQSKVASKSFWMQDSKQVLEWWSRKGTVQSVDVSFRLLDALADLSGLAASDTQLWSSQILHSKVLNQLLRNWLVAWVSDNNNIYQDKDNDETTTTFILPTPPAMLETLEIYKRDSYTTSKTRQKFRPDLESYQLLMEAASARASVHVPTDFQESLVRHLMKQQDGNSNDNIQPDLKMMAHILHGWSTQGKAVTPQELNTVLELLKEQLDRNNTNDNHRSKNSKEEPVDLLNQALFAMSCTNSNSKDSRDAEKMLSVLNYMETTMASACEDEHVGRSIHPNVETYNLVLNAFSRAGKAAQAEMVLRSMVDRYIQAHDNNPQQQQGDEAISTSSRSNDNEIKANAKPIPKSFTIVIAAFGRSEENHAAEKAEGILRWQQELNASEGPLQGSLAPETITFNNVFRAWSWRRSDIAVERCERLRKEMYQNNLIPDHHTYGQSLKAIALSNLKEKGRYAVQVWREMEFRGIEADSYTREHFEKCVALSAQREQQSSAGGRNRQRSQRAVSAVARSTR
ncbi:Pentatricopeptide repeat-containing protein [Seminavis robusta]|uniref:Pentatricopeptide repeat-containing protein n=1 Tax=Seminavis robusta TaxID=568900 RepID=A0A9N8EAV0_9STRA|nr:Pentatricopeptide repeat-containing protein [Seminavis robusta]|eukprot:Sro900_g217800.1 Pentatricopeptide repeat-containing protein (643) ;mRNA; r:4480-6408